MRRQSIGLSRGDSDIYSVVEMFWEYLVNEVTVLKRMGYRRNKQNMPEVSQTCPVSS